MSSTPHFSLRVSPGDTIQTIISVSKKVSKRAVVRNTVKRRIRPLLREWKLSLKPGVYMLIVKPGAETLQGQELRDELAQVLKKS